MDVTKLAEKFNALSYHETYHFDCQPIPGSPPVLQVTVKELDELPVYVTITRQQILCIVYLWTEQEVNPDNKEALLNTLLELNVPMPLSSFAKTDDKYMIFGALSLQSSFEDILHEIITLHDNAMEATSALAEYLV
ncbi:YjfI family protein [Spartinivicinus ruber]|uniref:YjfI family protein n=1 Tax=Spartinivicinus ruber TaxID=2683272 RepID=UPI0013D600BD|nr:DUF2170 family protein [Spartinivicinus ruber]